MGKRKRDHEPVEPVRTEQAAKPAPESVTDQTLLEQEADKAVLEQAVPTPAPAEPAAAAAATDDATQALVEPPERAVKRLSEELERLRDQHLRLAADFDNFRKRTQRERAETWSRAQAAVVASILDALDDLGRVAGLDAASAQARDVLAGVELVQRKLVRELQSAGLERVGAAGERFDPNLHEAVATAPASSAEQDHLVADVHQAGYRFAGALLRPARVTVYVWQEAPSGDGSRSG